MDQNKEKIRHILQYYYYEAKNAPQAANKICAAYGPDTVSISTVHFRFHSVVEVVVEVSSNIAIKSLNWSRETGIVAAVASSKSCASYV